MSEDSWPSHARWCVIQPNCRLCQFDLIKGDKICFALDPVADTLSCVFEFEKRGQKCLDEGQDIEFHLSLRSPQCGVCDENATTFCLHLDCRSQVLFDTTPSFLAATNYAYLPPPAEKRRRSRYLQNAMSENLCQSDHASKLPPELWRMIAGYLTHGCAAVTAQEQDHAYPKIDNHHLDLRRPVFASYVKVDGNIYVRDLHNAASNGDSCIQTCRILPACESSDPIQADIYIAEDHLGIRKVVFLTSTTRDAWCSKQDLVPGVWWRRLPIDLCATIQIQSDGLKVRQIDGPSEQTLRDPLSELLWQTPLASPPNLLSIVTLDDPPNYPNRRRMKYFECNHPDADGYLVACSGFQIYDIAVHKRDQKSCASLCEDLPDHLPHWMYMPLDEGEHITHISRQLDHDDDFRLVHIGLTFTTNQGRNTVFGEYATATDRVITVSRNKSRVHLNWWDNPDGKPGLQYVALERAPQPDAVHPYKAPSLPVALGIPPLAPRFEAWTRTACSLQGISEIQPCVRRATPLAYVIGMLVCYTNGHRECIGQFRPDWAAESISLLEKNTLYLRYARFLRGMSGIVAVTNQAPCESDGVGWKAIPTSGILEWWFAGGYPILFQNGQRVEVPEEMLDESAIQH